MRTNFFNKTVCYSDIFDTNSGIHGWGVKELFPIDQNSQSEKIILSNINAVEQIFDGVRGNRNIFNLLILQYNQFVKCFLQTINSTAYLLHTDSFPEKANKIRTYKGVVSKKIKNTDYIQIETPLKNGDTSIGAIIRISEENIDYCLDLFADRKTSCILTTLDNTFFSKQSLASLIIDFISHDKSNTIDYLKMVKYFSAKGDLVCRIGGDGGDLEMSFQVFTNKENKSFIFDNFQKAALSL